MGGKTRYRFDDKEGRGTYFCSHCGAGTGLDLVMKVNQCNARQAAKLVANVLAMPLPEKGMKPAPAKEVPSTDKPIAEQIAALMAKTVLGESHYLMNKGLHCPGLPILPNGVLLLALQAIDGEITGAQRIYPNGDKPYLTGTRKKGAFIPVGELPERAETVLITEGYATAVTVSLLASGIAIAALDAGNLIEVAKICRERWSEAKIIIAADNDCDQANQCDEKCQLKQNIGASVRVAQFGDGYQQVAGDGINPERQSWPLTFQGTEPDMLPLLTFIRQHTIKACLWTPPYGGIGTVSHRRRFYQNDPLGRQHPVVYKLYL